MSKSLANSVEYGRFAPLGPKFDIYMLAPVLVFAYAEIIAPLLLQLDLGLRTGTMWSDAQAAIILAPRLEHKIFWPALAMICSIAALRNWFKLTFPAHIICLFSYLALAGASVLWAFKPEFALARFAQQAMIVTSIILPALLAAPTADLMRGVYFCIAIALIINIFFVLNQPPIVIENVRVSYPGYFTFKGLLGECAAVGLLLSLYEILHRGFRRLLGIGVIGISIYLVVVSDSNGSLALTLLAPLLAALTLFIARQSHASPAIVLLFIPFIYVILSGITGNLVNRLSWYLFGNYTLSGRTIIWDFARFEIARSPLVGWGYQSFWLVGPDSPSILEAPGWVKQMPSSHNGYLDAMVDLGYVGLAFLVVFIFLTLHAIGRVLDRDPARAWLLLTLALFVILTNFLETTWMHGMDMLWLAFLLVAAESARLSQRLPRAELAATRQDPDIAPVTMRTMGSGKSGRVQRRRA